MIVIATITTVNFNNEASVLFHKQTTKIRKSITHTHTNINSQVERSVLQSGVWDSKYLVSGCRFLGV